MNIDLTNVTPAQAALLAAFATTLSALVAATAAFVTALVNARSARKLAETNLVREHRLKHIEPVVARLDQIINAYHLALLLEEDLLRGVSRSFHAGKFLSDIPLIGESAMAIQGPAPLSQCVIYFMVGQITAAGMVATPGEGDVEAFPEAAVQLYQLAALLRAELTTFAFTGRTRRMWQVRRAVRRIVAGHKRPIVDPSKPGIKPLVT
jgi:hypothetical protein